jgi:regulator of nonsense transcripts 2
MNTLDILSRLGKVHNLDANLENLLENARNTVIPPENKSIVIERLPTMQLYINTLIYKDLNNASYGKVLTRLKSLDWDDPLVVKWVFTAFVNVQHQKYTNMELVAYILSGLKRKYKNAVIQIVDAILESVRSHLEKPNYKEIQQQIASTRLLGELYNYKVIKVRLHCFFVKNLFSLVLYPLFACGSLLLFLMYFI